MPQGKIINSRSEMDEVVRNSKVIAVLGIKPDSMNHQPAHYVPAYLAQRGVDIVPVPVYYPEVTEILGKPVVRKLSDIGRPIDMVNVFRRPADVPPHLEDILASNPKYVWMQSGIRHDEVAKKLTDAGIDVVQDQCLMVEYGRVFPGR